MPRKPVIPARERVHRCVYCGRELRRDVFARRENPWCERCLTQRLAAGAAEHGAVLEWVEDGGYLRPIRAR
jgi:hypothetical protein